MEYLLLALSLVFLLTLLLPGTQRLRLDRARRRTLARLERERGRRVIPLIHRQESLSFLGFPVLRFIDVNDAEKVIRAIRQTPDERPIDLVLHTPGGLILASIQIARAVRAHPAGVTVIVPHMAMSGGTLIALAAQEIVMDEHAVLGPVDPQLAGHPAASILAAVARKDPNHVDDETLILADLSEKALRQVRAEVKELLAERFPSERVDELATLLTQGTWTHDHPIGFAAARELGLPVQAGPPRGVYELMALYPQPLRLRPQFPARPAPGPQRPGPAR